MVSGLSGVWFSLFLQRILMSPLHPAILRPSTGQSSESLPWSSLAFPGLPWPSLAWSTVVCLVFAGLPSCSLAFPRPLPGCRSNLCSLLLYIPPVFAAVPNLDPSACDTSSSSSLSSASWCSLVFHGFPCSFLVFLAHEDPPLEQLRNNGCDVHYQLQIVFWGGSKRCLKT